MQSLGYISKLRVGCRGIALVLLMALALSPSCSTMCPARNCPISQPAEREAGCHHEPAMNSDDSPTITAGTASCGLQKLLVALPVAKYLLETGVPRASSTTLVPTVELAATCAPVLSDSSLSRDTGPTHFVRSAARQFTFDTFVYLRV
jgi:hypothetical protein